LPRKAISEFTAVGIRKTTRERLKKFGCKADFYDDIIVRLMNFYEEHKDEYPEK
jgi:hypothetical protein